jgi:hypothetical protein
MQVEQMDLEEAAREGLLYPRGGGVLSHCRFRKRAT